MSTNRFALDVVLWTCGWECTADVSVYSIGRSKEGDRGCPFWNDANCILRRIVHFLLDAKRTDAGVWCAGWAREI